jgi:hypothetical protein
MITALDKKRMGDLDSCYNCPWVVHKVDDKGRKYIECNVPAHWSQISKDEKEEK